MKNTSEIILKRFQVIGTNPPDGQIIKQGQTVTLTCSTNVNWFFCVWKSPDGGKQCAIQQEATTQVKTTFSKYLTQM